MKDDRVYLQHIQDALNDIASYCGSDREGSFNDRMRQDATLRKLEVIGQAVVTPVQQSLETDRRHARQIIHDYFGVNLEIVWAVVQKELPKLAVAWPPF